MNKHLFLPGIVALLFTACGPVYVVHQDPPPPPPPAAEAPAPEDVTYQAFYDQLSPYGQWIENPDYGYVWMPDAGPDFKPYASNGNWVYTDEGWAWNSGYPWGWATFHYGRWFFQDGYGWMWLPGNEWAPAWVEWRNSDDYYGWAPLGPNISFGMAVGGGYAPPTHYWSFVPHQYVASPQMSSYYVRETNNVTIINRTTIINNTTVVNHPRNNHWGAGPDPNDVGRYGGRPVRPMPVRESRNPNDKPNSADYVVYRPRINSAPANGGGGNRPAPPRVQTLNDARPVNRNNYGGNNNNGWNRNNQPASNPPANNPPVNNNPTYTRPGNNNPAFNRPANNPPASNPPANNPPVNNNPPANNPPVNNQPANNNPNFNRPGNGNPNFVRPGNNNPAFNRPMNNPPANNQPANNQPANNQPANNPPANNRPVRTGNPSYNPPAGQPQQNQPRPQFNRPTGQNNPNNGQNTQNNNNNQPKPAANTIKYGPPQRNPQPQQPQQQPKKDEPKKDQRP
jgi:hypothetical protein